MSERQTHNNAGYTFYLLITLCALGLMVIPLIAYGMREWSLILPMIGGLTIVLRLRSGPLIFLFVLVYYIISAMVGLSPGALLVHILEAIPRALAGYRLRYYRTSWGQHFDSTNTVVAMLFTLSVLIYLIAHYRLVGIMRGVLPSDRRLKSKRKAKKRQALEQPRNGRFVNPQEGVVIFLTALFCSALAQLVWIWAESRYVEEDLEWLTKGRVLFRMNEVTWQFLSLLWVGGMLLVIAFSVIGYLGTRRLNQAEAEMLIQDDLWRDTRREQSRIHRWTAWGNKRRT